MLTLNDGRSELWQWDTGRKLTVDADCTQVHFSNKFFGRSVDVDVFDGTAEIPDVLLQVDKDLLVWAFVGTAENGYTKISKIFKVNKRNKPADYVFTPTEQTTLDEIMKRLDRIEESQDPDAIKNAVDEYLANNPIQTEEEDPTVPDWAKQPTKPKYTAQEVGAVATVNGTAPDENGNVEIEIPEAGGTGNYSELINKPKINGVELDGEKSLEDLGISQVNEDQIAEAVEDYFAENPIDIPNVDLTGYVKSVNGKQPDENGNVEITFPENSGEGLSDGSVKKNHIDGIEYEDTESSDLFNPATMIYQGSADTGGVSIRGDKCLDYGKYSGLSGFVDALAIIPLRGTTEITVSGLNTALSSNIFFMNEMPDPWYMMVSVMGVCRLQALRVQRFESPKTANSIGNVDTGEISGTVTQNDDGSYSINTGSDVYQYMAFAYRAANAAEMENVQARISGDDENVSVSRDITKMFGHGIADTEARYKLAKKPLDNMKWCVLGDSISTPHANEGITMYFDIVADKTGISPVSIAVPATGYRVGGDSKISGQIANIPDDADIITIMAGTNDSVSDLGTLGDAETTTLYGAVRATLQAVIDAHPTVSLGVITSVPTAPDYKSYADVQKIATVVREVAASMSIPCLDLAHGSGLVSGSHFRDYIVHPNNLGHELMAKKIAPWLLTL